MVNSYSITRRWHLPLGQFPSLAKTTGSYKFDHYTRQCSGYIEGRNISTVCYTGIQILHALAYLQLQQQKTARPTRINLPNDREMRSSAIELCLSAGHNLLVASKGDTIIRPHMVASVSIQNTRHVADSALSVSIVLAWVHHHLSGVFKNRIPKTLTWA
jgi:hypothetical protein